MDLKKATYLTVLLIGIVFILIIGKELIIPILLAMLMWFLVKEMRQKAQTIPFIKKRIPKWLLNLIAVVILYSCLGLIIRLLVINIEDLRANIGEYVTNLENFNTLIKSNYDFDISAALLSYQADFDFTEYLRQSLTSLTDLLGNTFMIAIYLLFMLLEETLFNAKLMSMSRSKEKRDELEKTLGRISDSISSYISLKTIVSLITGSISYIILLSFGVDSPLFWAFLIFVLNFIPTIGSLIATLFPALMALMQFGEIDMALYVLLCVGATQVIIGNIIEPKIMGNSLNVSGLVVILALSLWGAIWGITGMILSVPITVILVILFGQFPATKNIAIFLSDKGVV